MRPINEPFKSKGDIAHDLAYAFFGAVVVLLLSACAVAFVMGILWGVLSPWEGVLQVIAGVGNGQR